MLRRICKKEAWVSERSDRGIKNLVVANDVYPLLYGEDIINEKLKENVSCHEWNHTLTQCKVTLFLNQIKASLMWSNSIVILTETFKQTIS